MINDVRNAVCNLVGPRLEILRNCCTRGKITRSCHWAYFKQDLRTTGRSRSRLAHPDPGYVSRNRSNSHNEMRIALGQYLTACGGRLPAYVHHSAPVTI